MSNQFIKISVPSLGQDLTLSLGFQRVVAIVDGAKTGNEAIKRTSAALNELYIGWGTKSTEWKDLCRILSLYGFPVPIEETEDTTDSDLTSHSIQQQITKLAQFVCLSTKRLVELLCALQSICLQRLSNTLQQCHRSCLKDLHLYKQKVKSLNTKLSTINENKIFDQSEYNIKFAQEKDLRLQHEATIQELNAKIKQTLVAALASEEKQTQTKADLTATITTKLNLESELYTVKNQLLQECAKNRQLQREADTFEKIEKLNFESEIAHLRQRLLSAESLAFNQAVELARYGNPYANNGNSGISSIPTPRPSIIYSQAESFSATHLTRHSSQVHRLKKEMEIVENPDVNEVTYSHIESAPSFINDTDAEDDMAPTVIPKAQTPVVSEKSSLIDVSNETVTNAKKTAYHRRISSLEMSSILKRQSRMSTSSLKLAAISPDPVTQNTSIIQQNSPETDKTIMHDEDLSSNYITAESGKTHLRKLFNDSSSNVSTHDVNQLAQNNPNVKSDQEFMHYLRILMNTTSFRNSLQNVQQVDEPSLFYQDCQGSDVEEDNGEIVQDNALYAEHPSDNERVVDVSEGSLVSDTVSEYKLQPLSTHVAEYHYTETTLKEKGSKLGLKLRTQKSISALKHLFKKDGHVQNAKNEESGVFVEEKEAIPIFQPDESVQIVNVNGKTKWWKRAKNEKQ